MRAYNGPPFANLSFSKDASGFVHLSGLACEENDAGTQCASVALAAGTTKVFRLPSAFRPSAQHVFTTLSVGNGTNYLHTRVDVTADGFVQIVAPPLAGMDWVSFDGVTFLSR